jgi:hypothetical protein
VNQRVQVFWRACLTVKLLGSSKTVTTLPLEPLVVASSFSAPSGEMGMVSSGTGSVGLEATSAMFAICDDVGGCCWDVVGSIGSVVQMARVAII